MYTCITMCIGNSILNTFLPWNIFFTGTIQRKWKNLVELFNSFKISPWSYWSDNSSIRKEENSWSSFGSTHIFSSSSAIRQTTEVGVIFLCFIFTTLPVECLLFVKSSLHQVSTIRCNDKILNWTYSQMLLMLPTGLKSYFGSIIRIGRKTHQRLIGDYVHHGWYFHVAISLCNQ